MEDLNHIIEVRWDEGSPVLGVAERLVVDMRDVGGKVRMAHMRDDSGRFSAHTFYVPRRLLKEWAQWVVDEP